MSLCTLHKRSAVVLFVALVSAASLVQADTWENKFYEAFYLEVAQRDVAAAAELYGQVATAAEADATLKVKANSRWQACQEELASTDFARLMPPDTIVYIELNRPGEQLNKLIEQLGLLATADRLTSEGEQKLAISPALVNAFLDMRGAAVAVTGFNPVGQEPIGVAVLHPGNLEFVRGLIETALPVAAEPAKPIAGHPTYKVEGKVLVTLTKRLVVVSPQRGLIVNVIRRLNGETDKSLVTSEALADVLTQRDDALLFLCVNAQPIMPLINAAMAGMGTQSRELAAAQALLDLNSLHSLSGRAGISDDGIFLDVALRLNEGHRNLVYNLLRLPPLDQDTLRCVPRGAAAFVAAALNDAEAQYTAAATTTGEPQVVTGLDFGREIFANIIGLNFYALPSEGERSAGGLPIPDVAAAITVHDPAKSEALWTQMLGVASLAAGAPAIEGQAFEIEGTRVRSYAFPEGVTVYFTTLDDTVLISPSKSAMARSIAARQSGKSILDDPTFAGSLKQLTPDSTIAAFVHPGRCAKIAKQFAPPAEIAEIEPWLDVLDETVASFVVTHSCQVFRLSAMVTGIPDISDMVTQLIRRERQKNQLTRLVHDGQWDQALEQVEGLSSAKTASDVGLLMQKFRIQAVGQGDRDAALATGKAILDKAGDDARLLNNLAWDLLTEEQYEDQYDELALRISQRSNELTDHGVWQYVDTLALAKFKTGDAAAAIELEKKALSLCNDASQTLELKKALARFEAALKQADIADKTRG
jgi:hypothetical protein